MLWLVTDALRATQAELLRQLDGLASGTLGQALGVGQGSWWHGDSAVRVRIQVVGRWKKPSYNLGCRVFISDEEC
jgi:hypothetical protein